MKSRFITIFPAAALALTCSCSQPTTQSVSAFRYLGIPDNEEYPNTTFRLDTRVPQKYYRVSRLTHVTEAEFQRDVKQGKVLFPERRQGTEYYATEYSAHIEQQAGVREWVTILQRNAFP